MSAGTACLVSEDRPSKKLGSSPQVENVAEQAACVRRGTCTQGCHDVRNGGLVSDLIDKRPPLSGGLFEKSENFCCVHRRLTFWMCMLFYLENICSNGLSA